MARLPESSEIRTSGSDSSLKVVWIYIPRFDQIQQVFIDVLSITDMQNVDDQSFVNHLVDNSVGTFLDAVDMLETRHMERFVTRGMGILTQCPSCLEKYNPECLGKFLDRSRRGAIKLDFTDHQQSNRIP